MTQGEAKAPAIILARPQMGENIGAAARVMRNFGLTDMRIVSPRDGWPNKKADALAAGAVDVLETARVSDDFASAVSDLTLVFATTARSREMVKPVMTPREAMARAKTETDRAGRAGVLFGAEATGLLNEELAAADILLTIPVDPGFSSLNLAQAVAVTAYEWRAGDAAPEDFSAAPLPATKQELMALMDHLEAELERKGFFFPDHKAESMKRNLRAGLTRGNWTHQDVQTLRGAIKALTGKRGG